MFRSRLFVLIVALVLAYCSYLFFKYNFIFFYYYYYYIHKKEIYEEDEENEELCYVTTLDVM